MTARQIGSSESQLGQDLTCCLFLPFGKQKGKFGFLDGACRMECRQGLEGASVVLKLWLPEGEHHGGSSNLSEAGRYYTVTGN